VQHAAEGGIKLGLAKRQITTTESYFKTDQMPQLHYRV
jgi:hypothetical protein